MAGRNYIKNLTERTFGLSYTSDLFFGSHEVPGEIVYDTGSGWLTIASSECHNCYNKVYNHKESSTAVAYDASSKYLQVALSPLNRVYSMALRNLKVSHWRIKCASERHGLKQSKARCASKSSISSPSPNRWVS